MARRDNLIKSKSIYTIRKKHMTTDDGVIYEHDHITIMPNDGIYDEDMPLFSDSNFKFRIRKGSDTKKRHIRDSFIKLNDEEEWTRENLPQSEVSSENKVEIKPNYSSLADFAYYGSAVELIHATVNDIITRFPGSICNYTHEISATIDGQSYLLISNETNIDCWSKGIDYDSDTDRIKVLSVGYDMYEDDSGYDINKPSITSYNVNCFNTFIGEMTITTKNPDSRKNNQTIYIYQEENGNKKIYCKEEPAEEGEGEKRRALKFSISPKKKYKDEFWDSLNEFEKVLLNRKSNPIYMAEFDTPFFTRTGYYYNKQKYIWPTVTDKYTPDMSSAAYEGYVNRLIKLAEFNDEYNSDNLWRMITHESIKNLDWTFVVDKDGNKEDVDIDSSRMEGIVHVYGRQFDDLKMYADNIKSTNTITYDENNNVPDYFLSDSAENDGWEVYNTAASVDSADTVYARPYSATTNASSAYSQSDANVSFLRRLCLNSDYIQSLKGTRKGIETVLGLFGMFSGQDYTIEEKIGVADLTQVIDYNKLGELRALGEYVNYGENTDYMKGYPVIGVTPKGTPSISGNTLDYAIPWYDKDEDYSYPFYFQEKGGWAKRVSKKINVSISGAPSEISAEDAYYNYIYGETEPYMKYASTIDEMLNFKSDVLEDGMICYVTDISDMFISNNNIFPETAYESGNTTNYFYLNNKAISHYLGNPNTELYNCAGWVNVKMSQLTEKTKTIDAIGKKVLYLESIKAYYKGNNPHVGNFKYDLGGSYINKYRNIFMDAVENGLFDEVKDSDPNAFKAICESGFCIAVKNVPRKCYYFSDDLPMTAGEKDEVETDYTALFTKSAREKNVDTKYDEAYSYSIVNLKHIVINFNIENNPLLDYIEDVVIKYLEQMIPSTTIVEYKFNGLSYGAIADGEFDATNIISRITAHAAYIPADEKENVYNEVEGHFDSDGNYVFEHTELENDNEKTEN